ncbi:uncharacterized protein LOC112591500 [Melanaphis sacchari]|uniref:uncharacterized protein LOC112591500 n=1 Tax=Melanaphis sacchari TaxID=742174 RepID=UPI000DC15473|nr:uncharacterized protein LOC112591500 [Melanaphis sacchari]
MANSAVCSKHFEPNQIIREWTSGHIKYALKKPRLKEGAIPTIFPDIPKSCLKSIPKTRKSPKKRLLACDTQIIQSSYQTPHEMLFDCELETSTVAQSINQFSAWNSVELLELPNLSWSLFKMQHFKIIASIELSLHSDPETVFTII